MNNLSSRAAGFLFFIPLLFVQGIFAQSKLTVIRASSKTVDINDGGFLDKHAWNLSPKARPDIFTADRTRKTKWVTFYTDIDSIRVKVKPGTSYDFIILLNGKDSCYTRIVSAIPPENRVKSSIATNDTLPFTLTSYNAIQVKAVINDIDTLNLHFDISSFDFDLTKEAILKKTRLLSNQPDALTGKATPNYNKLDKVSKIQMGGMVWKDPVVAPTGFTAHDMDGRFGWNLFEGKSVEIDYDHNLLIIRSRMPAGLKGYTRSKISYIRSFVVVGGVFIISNKKYSGNFLLDTGSEEAIILDSTWVAEQDFPRDLKLIRTSVLKDPRGVKYENKIVVAPLLKVNDFALTDIPTCVLSSRSPVGFTVNYFGNDLLKRFNMILDFQHDQLYLKPNKLMGVKYRENS